MSIDDRRVFRIARRIMAGAEQLGNVYYHVLSDQQVSLIFTISSNRIDELDGWMDTMLGTKDEIKPIAKKYGFMHLRNSMDMVDVGDAAMTYPLVYGGKDECDINGFIDEMKKKYNCVEVKG